MQLVRGGLARPPPEAAVRQDDPSSSLLLHSSRTGSPLHLSLTTPTFSSFFNCVGPRRERVALGGGQAGSDKASDAGSID